MDGDRILYRGGLAFWTYGRFTTTMVEKKIVEPISDSGAGGAVTRGQ